MSEWHFDIDEVCLYTHAHTHKTVIINEHMNLRDMVGVVVKRMKGGMI